MQGFPSLTILTMRMRRASSEAKTRGGYKALEARSQVQPHVAQHYCKLIRHVRMSCTQRDGSSKKVHSLSSATSSSLRLAQHG